MPVISARSIINVILSLLAALGMCLAAGAQDQAPAGERQTEYSKKELTRMFDKAKDDVRPAQAAGDDADVVELEPVEVKSDDAQIVRKIDQSMKSGSPNPATAEMLRIFTEQNRKLLQDALYDARASDRFFNEEEQHIGPADVPGTGKLVFWKIPNKAKNDGEKVTEAEAKDQQPKNP